MFMRKPRRLLAMFAMALLVSFTAACDDDPAAEEEDPADLIETMRLTVGAQVINVRKADGNVTGGPIVKGPGATTITATFLDASGNTVSGLDAEFELRVTSGNTAFVTFTGVSAFAGTLNRVAAGSTTLTVGLFHAGEQHFDVGPFPVAITVQ
jgi:hypothetical protein